MRSLLSFIFLCALFAVVSASSCRTGGRCELPLNVNQSEIVVAFKDQATGKYLYSESNPLYNKDSIRVFDESGNSLFLLSQLDVIPNTNSRFWRISFGPLYNQQTDAAAFDAELCRSFIIKYNHTETDTVKACFKAKKTKCGSVFETLQVYHKDQLVGFINNNTGISIIVTKH